jgi:hypothetical protein
MSDNEEEDVDFWLLVENSHPHSIIFVLEPWGEAHDLEPDAALMVCARGPAPAGAHLQAAENEVTLYCPSGSTAFLYRDGESDHMERPRVPGVPEGFYGHRPTDTPS